MCTYVGVLPTHEALHPPALGHRPVDLWIGMSGRGGELRTFNRHRPTRYTSPAFTRFLGMFNRANISPAGLAASQLQSFNEHKV